MKVGLAPPVVAALVAAAVATAAKANNSVVFKFRRLGGRPTPLPSTPSPSSCSFRHHSPPFFFLPSPPLAVQWVWAHRAARERLYASIALDPLEFDCFAFVGAGLTFNCSSRHCSAKSSSLSAATTFPAPDPNSETSPESNPPPKAGSGSEGEVGLDTGRETDGDDGKVNRKSVTLASLVAADECGVIISTCRSPSAMLPVASPSFSRCSCCLLKSWI
mmetsp:Transcript_35938/g.96288  ORF Transcript_35938/g.96288 Transcript_35938/m.96288 type:complete len:218 (-) Transcript_35938:2751-3404(-)